MDCEFFHNQGDCTVMGVMLMQLAGGAVDRAVGFENSDSVFPYLSLGLYFYYGILLYALHDCWC